MTQAFMRTPRSVELALLATALFLTVPGCKDDDPSPTAPSSGVSNPGTNPVGGGSGNSGNSGNTGNTGTGGNTGNGGTVAAQSSERLAWNQTGDTSQLRFRAYIDSNPFDLPDATCNGATPNAECTSPLPALSTGTHSIQLTSVLAGTESDRSPSITYQKTAAAASYSALPLAWDQSAALRVERVITIADGLSFTADVVATGVRGPAQLAWLPDGRLLLSDADGRVRMVRPGEPEGRELALDAEMLTSQRAGTMGIVSHPDFAQNHLVYLSLLEHGRLDQTTLRVVRLREVGDTLGEAATLFEAPVAGSAVEAGPRMAFGPDRLLYLMLPPGMEFVHEPAASTPNASMLRLDGDGRAVSAEPLSGVTSSPLAFTWSPATGALWVMFRGANGEAAVRSFDTRARVQAMGAGTARLRVWEGTGTAAGTLLHHSTADDLLVAQALVSARADGSKGVARLALPAQADDGLSARIGDLVAGDAGTLFAVTSNGVVDGAAGTASDVVVRLKPVPSSAAR